MAAQVQGYPRCPCGNTQGSFNKSGSEIPNGFEGIYFIVGQQQSPPRRPVETNTSSLAPVASSRTSVPTSSSPAGPPPPPPPIIPGPPPPPLPSNFPEDGDDDGGFDVGAAIKGFFANGGKTKLRPASERKLGPVPRRKPRTGATTIPRTQAAINLSNGLASTPVHSTIQGPSEVEGSGGGSAPTVDTGAGHVELLNNALITMRPALQDSDDEDSEEEHTGWNEDDLL